MNLKLDLVPWILFAALAATWITLAAPGATQMSLGHGHGKPCRNCH